MQDEMDLQYCKLQFKTQETYIHMKTQVHT